MFFLASIHDQFLPETSPKRILFFKVGTNILKQFRFWNWPRAFSGSGSGSRTDSDILAVPGPVLKDFCPRVRFSGTWTDPGTTLPKVSSPPLFRIQGGPEQDGQTKTLASNKGLCNFKVQKCGLNYIYINLNGREDRQSKQLLIN